MRAIIITNASSTDYTVDLVVVTSGQDATSSPSILPTRTVPANDILQVYTYLPLNTVGDTIQIKSSMTSGLSVFIGGMEVTQ